METWEKDLQKHLLQKAINCELGFDVPIEKLIEKGKVGVFEDNEYNRKMGRVGQPYGGKKTTEPSTPANEKEKKIDEKKEEKSLKDKFESIELEKYNFAQNEYNSWLKRLSEYREKGYHYSKQPWQKHLFNEAANKVDKAIKNKEKAEYGHSLIKNIFKDLGIVQSVYRSTAIRGYSIPSSGYEFGVGSDSIELNGIGSARFKFIVDKLKEVGFEVGFGVPSKVIGGSNHGSISLNKIYNFEKKK